MIDALNDHIDDDESPGPSYARRTVDNNGTSVGNRCLFGANIHEET